MMEVSLTGPFPAPPKAQLTFDNQDNQVTISISGGFAQGTIIAPITVDYIIPAEHRPRADTIISVLCLQGSFADFGRAVISSANGYIQVYPRKDSDDGFEIGFCGVYPMELHYTK